MWLGDVVFAMTLKCSVANKEIYEVNLVATIRVHSAYKGFCSFLKWLGCVTAGFARIRSNPAKSQSDRRESTLNFNWLAVRRSFNWLRTAPLLNTPSHLDGLYKKLDTTSSFQFAGNDLTISPILPP